MSSQKQRETWVDVLRAFAMFLVVLGHIYADNPLYFLITGPVKMPLFYILSGYVVNLTKKPKQFFKDLLFRLGPAWIIFSLFPYRVVVHLIHGDVAACAKYIVSFFTGETVWFIPSFFVTQCLVYILYKFFGKKPLSMLLISLASFFVGLATANIGVFDLWCVNTALTGVLFMTLGCLTKEHKEFSKKIMSKGSVIAGGLIVYVILLIVSYIFYPESSINFHTVSYYNILICLLLIVAGAVVCSGIAIRVCGKLQLKPICILGQNTLIVYLLHGNVVSAVKKCFGIFGISYNGFFVEAVFLAICACIGGTLISLFCGKYIPWIVGKKRKPPVREIV